MKINFSKFTLNIILNIAIILVIMVGVFARFYFWKNGIGYFDDDYSLVKQVMNFSYGYLLTHPLEDNQFCPIFYVITLKFLYSHFGLNHQILGLLSLLCSLSALILMPIVTYKICKNRFASFIAAFLIAFNPQILYFTQRLKHYSTDIFLSLFLFLFGLYIFSKPITKKRMLLFTIVCIICGLSSYSAIIIIACLCFYYLFLFEKDDIKTKFKNFLIFIIPWLIIFIPYLLHIGIRTYSDPCYITFWMDEYPYIQNFEQFKLFICYMFGHHNTYQQISFPILTLYSRFWYLFFAVFAGIIIIFVKKDKFLFSILILPIIISQILGIMNVYPCAADRVSLWLIPGFILLFVLPASFIKFEKKAVTLIVSVVIIIYYLFIFDKTTIESISNIKNYNYGQNTVNIFIEELKKSDIKDKDVICICGENFIQLFDVFDSDGKFNNNKKVVENICRWNDIYPEKIPKNENVYFYLFKDNQMYGYTDEEQKQDKFYNYIKENMNIVYDYNTWYGDIFVKARRK